MSRTTDYVIDKMNDEPIHNAKCLSRHLGVWAMTKYGLERWHLWYAAAQAACTGGTLPIISAASSRRAVEDIPLYEIQNGVAVVGINGPMMKGDSKFGGANTVRIREAIRAASMDESVKSIMLQIDSPGGSVAGTDELARTIAKADAIKPVYAHIDDLGASAAYWVASQARKLTASPAAEVGSIGVYAVVEDSSKAAAAEGITVHVISTGPMKGALQPGTPITPEQLAHVQERVDEMNGHFQAAIVRGRGDKITRAQLKEVSDGRIFGAKDAKAFGLIDKVESFDEALAAASPKSRRTAAMAYTNIAKSKLRSILIDRFIKT